jgi:hypothetical protein
MAPPPPTRPWWIRLLLSLLAGFGAAIVAAILLAVVDLYLSGHGLRTLGGPWLDWSAAGVHLSRADVLLLVAAGLAAAVAWHGSAAGGV